MSVSTRSNQPVLAALPRIRSQAANILGLILVSLVVLWLVVNAVKAPGSFTLILLRGLTDGSLYALVALGYTLVYGIIELINFAHGDVFMWGTMIATTLAYSMFSLVGKAWYIWVPLAIATTILTMSFCGTLNVAIERIAYKPLRNAPKLAPLITAIGMSYILQNVAAIFYGFGPRNFNDILPTGAIFHLAGVAYRWKSLIVILATIPVLVALTYLVRYTKQGKAMRATAQDMDAARMLGINVDRTISFTFALGGVLAGAAGVLYVFYYTNTAFDLGFKLGLYAFTAAVLGGIGNLTGAALGGVLIGLIVNFNEGLSWHAPGSDWTESIIFGILIMILVFRPQGLLGEQTSDRA
jgi:branched-chain amino acid transport system permease protein